MDVLVGPLRIVLPGAYLLTVLLYARLYRAEEEAGYLRQVRWSLGITLLLHMGLLVAIAGANHRCPLGTQGEGLLFAAWILCLLHVAAARVTGTQSLGFFTIAPATAGVCAASFMYDQAFSLPEANQNSYFVFHIVASLTGYVCLCMAVVLASSYIALHRRRDLPIKSSSGRTSGWP
ncbi:MAG: hypothetical protein O2923_05150 [Verrucomicrobia bacterium]|nr:hypothetical protein [Verrucomicrobiota bacterium]MDA1087101.1 hypothetical protein [Verrucomicrobiota bacterium]